MEYNRPKQRRRNTIDFSVMTYGKMPPQSSDLEKSILGTLLALNNGIDIVRSILTNPLCFYIEAHQKIYAAACQLADKYQPYDAKSVVQQLQTNEVLELIGGTYYVMSFMNMAEPASLSHYAKIVLQMHLKREVIRTAGEIIGEAYDPATDSFELLENFAIDVEKISAYNIPFEVSTMVENSKEFLENLDARMSRKEDITGVPSGFSEIDIVTAGWQPTDLIILAARPAVGKSAFALNLARNAIVHPLKKSPTAFFSLEMSKSQLVERLYSAELEMNFAELRRGRITQEQHLKVMQAVDRLEKLELYIDDSSNLTIHEFKSKARRLVTKFGVKFIIIDYLQLMSCGEKGLNRDQQIATITRGLKQCAKELKIPILALSQLARKVDERTSKIPVLGDLRESGAIEQDADLVMFIYRPDYYEDSKREIDKVAGETHINIAKHRNGSLEKIKLIAKLHIQRFYDWSDPIVKRELNQWQPIGKGDEFDAGFEDSEYKFS